MPVGLALFLCLSFNWALFKLVRENTFAHLGLILPKFCYIMSSIYRICVPLVLLSSYPYF